MHSSNLKEGLLQWITSHRCNIKLSGCHGPLSIDTNDLLITGRGKCSPLKWKGVQKWTFLPILIIMTAKSYGTVSDFAQHPLSLITTLRDQWGRHYCYYYYYSHLMGEKTKVPRSQAFGKGFTGIKWQMKKLNLHWPGPSLTSQTVRTAFIEPELEDQNIILITHIFCLGDHPLFQIVPLVLCSAYPGAITAWDFWHLLTPIGVWVTPGWPWWKLQSPPWPRTSVRSSKGKTPKSYLLHKPPDSSLSLEIPPAWTPPLFTSISLSYS